MRDTPYIPSEVWSEVVSRLRAYPQWRAWCAEIQDRRDDILHGTCKPEVMAGKGASSVVEAKGMRLCTLDRDYDQRWRVVQQVEDVMMQLPKTDRRYVELKWFQHLRQWSEDDIAKDTGYSVRQLRRRRPAIVAKFAQRMGLM